MDAADGLSQGHINGSSATDSVVPAAETRTMETPFGTTSATASMSSTPAAVGTNDVVGSSGVSRTRALMRSAVGRCCPRSTSLVQAMCVLVILGFAITVLFGRSVVAVIQGTLGILISLEGYTAAAAGRRWWLRLYAAFMVLNAAASITIGSVIFSGASEGVSGCSNEGTQAAACTAAQVVYGAVMLVGASSVGLFAAANAILVSFAMPARRANDEVEALLKGF